jgi:choline dehydrogenase-like flavoprotein
MKRRTVLAGLVGGSVAAATGLLVKKYSNQEEVKYLPLEQFQPSSDFDVCIIGTGPAGCTLAERLSAAGHRVLLLESGVSVTDSNGAVMAAGLDMYSSSGELDYPLQASRLRALGGTSNIWTGRCPRMLPSDFSDNPLAPGGSWPISYEELQPYYRMAEESLHVVGERLTAGHAPRAEDLPGPAGMKIDTLRSVLEPLNIAVDYPPVSHKRRTLTDDGVVRFARDSLPQLNRKDSVTVVSHATAARLLSSGDGSVVGIEARSVGGASKRITARRYVIAGGAVESTRLLMLSASDAFPSGIGNQSDQLGRYFMEHPFISYTATLSGRAPFDLRQLGRTYQFCPQLKQRGMGGILLGFYGNPNKPGLLKIALGIEMAPDENNRIQLNTDNRDAFGNPGADLKLAFSDRDKQLWKAGEEIVLDIFKQLNTTEVKKHDDSLHWSHHHMGSTRMSADATAGVVDPDLRVHGTKNLYVISSSVFVTAGVANPTLTITALAHRLSEHLDKKLS